MHRAVDDPVGDLNRRSPEDGSDEARGRLSSESADAALEATFDNWPPQEPGQITDLLLQWRDGDDDALGRLLPHFYKRLRRFAEHLMQSERGSHTLQATALVHEAYLRLVRLRQIRWRDRAQFFTVCSHLMRNILVDHARRRSAMRRAGDQVRVEMPVNLQGGQVRGAELLAVHLSIERLAEIDPELGELVVMRYFAGLSLPEVALVRGVSRSTVKRQWALARAWLHRDLTGGAEG